MKTNQIDFDFIGGHGSLTKTEEKELSDFFKSRKLVAKATIRQKVETTTRLKVVG